MKSSASGCNGRLNRRFIAIYLGGLAGQVATADSESYATDPRSEQKSKMLRTLVPVAHGFLPERPDGIHQFIALGDMIGQMAILCH
jgi:hypothetical protein